ncbi:MAG: rod shape-determining protein MreC [Gammaproteobacteria bacterium]|nr:rod shape-determining protein MreC [Gammaproteobacteria bacterium]
MAINPIKPLYFRRPSALVRLVVVGIVSIALMTADHKGRHLEFLRGVLATIVYPLQYAVDLPIQVGTWMAETVTSRSELMQQNYRLRRENLRIHSRLEKFAELEAENRRLRSLLDSSIKVGDKVLIAELLSVDMDPFARRIVLNKGTRDGVFSGQSLIDSNGVMGQVVQAGPFSSNALLITDPSHALPVQVHRSGYRAVAVGVGPQNLLELLHIPNNADLRVGDLLVTSGLGGRFPSGYPVGHIISVERDRGRPFASVKVEPTARLERNREVLLVWPAQGGETLEGMNPGTIIK